MPWNTFTLNDGAQMPGIAFGTWTLGGGQTGIDFMEQAIEVGFHHIDTAQMYKNEVEAGIALRESGLSRSDVFVTTKWSGTDGLDVETSIQNSLKNLGLAYVDLYLVHFQGLMEPGVQLVWSKMERIKEDGLAKSIGISNFDAGMMEILLQNAKVKPAVNQILFHPYVYEQQKPILEVAAKHGIVVEAYSSLIPARYPGGALDEPLKRISDRLNATMDQVLMAWVKAKGVVVVTMSTKKTRLEGYLKAGDIELTLEDVAALDEAGSNRSTFFLTKDYLRIGATAIFVTISALVLYCRMC